MALDRRNYKQCVETTVEIAKKVGSVEILNRIVDDLKDENEQYRKMVMETVQVRLSASFVAFNCMVTFFLKSFVASCILDS